MTRSVSSVTAVFLFSVSCILPAVAERPLSEDLDSLRTMSLILGADREVTKEYYSENGAEGLVSLRSAPIEVAENGCMVGAMDYGYSDSDDRGWSLHNPGVYYWYWPDSPRCSNTDEQKGIRLGQLIDSYTLNSILEESSEIIDQATSKLARRGFVGLSADAIISIEVIYSKEEFVYEVRFRGRKGCQDLNVLLRFASSIQVIDANLIVCDGHRDGASPPNHTLEQSGDA